MNSIGGTRIVYVEDDPDLVRLVTLLLHRCGCEVTGVTEAIKGFKVIQEQRPDIILLDLMMPEMDGWDLYKKLESDPVTRNIPVIVISAKAQAVDQVLGLYIAKADAYLCKPFKPPDLLEAIERVLLKRNQEAG